MIVFKAFSPGMVCGGYHYKPGESNYEAEANCAQNGIHAAENPADCLSYYDWDGKNEFWKCIATGDIDEDTVDSKIATTELIPEYRMSLTEYIAECAWYILQHPTRIEERSRGMIKICRDIGRQTGDSKVLLVAGENPKAEVTQKENMIVLVDTAKGTMRAGRGLAPGWYHIGKDGAEEWTD